MDYAIPTAAQFERAIEAMYMEHGLGTGSDCPCETCRLIGIELSNSPNAGIEARQWASILPSVVRAITNPNPVPPPDTPIQ